MIQAMAMAMAKNFRQHSILNTDVLEVPKSISG